MTQDDTDFHIPFPRVANRLDKGLKAFFDGAVIPVG